MNLTIRFLAVAAIVTLTACGGTRQQELPLTGQGPMAASTFDRIPAEIRNVSPRLRSGTASGVQPV